MRGCLGVLLLAAAFAIGGAWLGGPALAGVAVERALDAAGFDARTRTVEVTSDPPFEILAGRADRVVIRATDVVLEDLDADRLDVTLLDVDLLAATFARVEGRLEGAVVVAGDGSATEAETVELLGPPRDVLATVRMSGTVVDRIAREAVERETGIGVGAVTLEAPSTIAFTVGPARVDGDITVDTDGALAVALHLPGDPVVRILAPGGPFGLTAASVTDGDLVLIGRIDIDRYLR